MPRRTVRRIWYRCPSTGTAKRCFGPGAGTAGGTVCFEGTVEGLRASGTLTGRHLDDRAALKDSVRTPSGAL